MTENEIVTSPRVVIRKRDQQVRRLTRRYASLSNLADLRYRPALQSLARLTLLTDRAYEFLKSRESLLNEEGELATASIDCFRRLVDSQSALLKNLGLMPSSILPDGGHDRTLAAVFERVSRVSKSRAKEPDGPATASAV